MSLKRFNESDEIDKSKKQKVEKHNLHLFINSFMKRISSLLYCTNEKFNLPTLPLLCIEKIYLFSIEKIYHPQAKSRLEGLLDENNENPLKIENFLNKMTDMGNVIAGGSVVYSLCEHVERGAVGDIDIYVSKDINVSTTLRAIEKTFGKGNIKRIERYGREISGFKECFGVEYHNQNTITIQIIFMEFKSWRDIVESFDLDYVRCAYFDSAFYMTEDCARAHDTRKVTYKFCDIVTQSMINKAWKKGFSVPTTIFETVPDSGIRLGEIIYNDAIYQPNYIFSPLTKSEKPKRQKMNDEIISSYNPETVKFETLCGKFTRFTNLKLNRFKNLTCQDRRFSFDPIYIGGYKFSSMVAMVNCVKVLEDYVEYGPNIGGETILSLLVYKNEFTMSTVYGCEPNFCMIGISPYENKFLSGQQ